MYYIILNNNTKKIKAIVHTEQQAQNLLNYFISKYKNNDINIIVNNNNNIININDLKIK